jgi:hypothetical protein
MGTTRTPARQEDGALLMPRPLKSALVVLSVLGLLTLAPSSALADGTSDTVTSGGASGCCKIIN